MKNISEYELDKLKDLLRCGIDFYHYGLDSRVRMTLYDFCSDVTRRFDKLENPGKYCKKEE